MNNSIEVSLVLELFSLQNKIQKKVAGALSVHGISFTEYLVLLCLQGATEHKLRRIDLADEVGLSASGVTRLINPMEKIGLVDKQSNARDARVSFVVLTAAGMRVLEESQKSFDFAAAASFSSLEKAQKKMLLTGIQALH
ncbi:MAG: MarR family winged helix-turn-helix transcriptional regulator [Oceanococcus sp.]